MIEPDDLKPNEIRVTKEISDRFLADCIITAIEGGIGYWSQVVVYKWTEGPEHTIAEIMELDDEGEYTVHHKIDLGVIHLGLQRILALDFEINEGQAGIDPHWNTYTDILAGVSDDDGSYIDSTAADVIVQVGLFNEIVYG